MPRPPLLFKETEMKEYEMDVDVSCQAPFDTVKAVDDLELFIAERERQYPGFVSLVEEALERRLSATQPIVEDEPEDEEDEFLELGSCTMKYNPKTWDREQHPIPVDFIEFDGDGATVHFRQDEDVSAHVVVMLLNSVGKEK